MNKTVIEINNLYKQIDGNTILKNINLKIEEGCIIGITGKNGSGKSMLLKAIAGLIIPTGGQVRVFDKAISKGDIPQDMGILINGPGLLLQYSAFDNLKILAAINNKITNDDIKEILTTVGLNPNDKKAVKKFSMGMKQKVGIAQALMENPKIILLDEPMNGLDEKSVEDIRSLILNLKVNNRTIILTSHNKEDIEKLCDCVYSIKEGELIEY